MFRRRDSRPIHRFVWEAFYPRGGWFRASSYIMLRLQRLPDDPHRIGRGVAAGVFISFTPLFGFHFLGAAAIAWAIRGNILAALIATFAGNPLTTPMIAALSLETGRYLLGLEGTLSLAMVPAAFSQASMELWHNLRAFLGGAPLHWDSLAGFGREVFWPYLVGGLGPGIAAGLAGYAVSIPLVRAYRAHRARKTQERAARMQARLAAALPRRADGAAPNG